MLRALFLFPILVWAQTDPGFPSYSASSIANAAANVTGSYAPNTIISIYGVNLAAGTHAVTAAHVQGGSLPTSLGNIPVRVLVNNQPAGLYFVSPRQVNVLVPTNLAPGRATVSVVISGRAGPPVNIELGTAAPALFEMGEQFVVATHANGPVVTTEAPALPGEIVVLYATGLGPTSPLTPINQLATTAATLTDMAGFQVWLDGVPVERQNILYAGVTPGFAGLYQINLRLPENCPQNPEIRVIAGNQASPERRRLVVRR